jgi:2'-5' RNA ligase
MEHPENYRLFIALTLPEEVKEAITHTQAELRRALPEKSVSWTKREQFHLTLKFLGSFPANRVEALAGAVRNACGDFRALRLRAQGIGFFPDLKFPRVTWVGVRDAENILPTLQQAIEAAAKEFTPEKPEGRFTGHVTLGRVRELKRSEIETLKKLALGMPDKLFGEWTAGNVEIIRSELAPGGSRYTTLATVPLEAQAKA